VALKAVGGGGGKISSGCKPVRDIAITFNLHKATICRLAFLPSPGKLGSLALARSTGLDPRTIRDEDWSTLFIFVDFPRDTLGTVRNPRVFGAGRMGAL
jgi:hypothetical protein